MKVANLCVHIVMGHYLYGIYELLINQLALIIHIVNIILFFKSNLNSCSLARICKDETNKFGPITKVIWSAVKSSYVFFFL
jgi:hypothetical protein